MRDGGYPDDIRCWDHDPGSPFYPSNAAEEEAQEREDRFAAAAAEIEAIAGWLGSVWDHCREDARDDEGMVDHAEAVAAALCKALEPWAALIVAHEQELRAKCRVTAPMMLMGVTLEGTRK